MNGRVIRLTLMMFHSSSFKVSLIIQFLIQPVAAKQLAPLTKVSKKTTHLTTALTPAFSNSSKTFLKL